jgi:hypothetical protein
MKDAVAAYLALYWLRVSRTAQIWARGAEMAEFLGYQLNLLRRLESAPTWQNVRSRHVRRRNRASCSPSNLSYPVWPPEAVARHGNPPFLCLIAEFALSEKPTISRLTAQVQQFQDIIEQGM